MRLLHTSDWHLGRSFHGVGLLEAQSAFIDELVDTVRDRAVDVVLVAGDVYDRALPGVDVVNLFDDALARLRDAGAQVVVSSGNHDSATRLGFGRRLFARAGLHLRTRVADLDTPAVFDAGDHLLAVYGVPYLEPRMVAESLGVEAPGHPPVVAAALGRIREDLAERRNAADVPVLGIVLAHVFASGAEPSDSERELSVGGLDNVPVSYFEGFDYVALGHLHGRQALAETIRYSGSPLPYSFSEAGHVKGAIILDTAPGGVQGIEQVAFTPFKALRVLRGTLHELLEDPALESARDAWCQVTLTDRDRPQHAMERIRSRFPDTLVLAFDPQGRAEKVAASYGERLARAANPQEVCEGFVDHVRQRPPTDAETRLLADILASAASEEVTA